MRSGPNIFDSDADSDWEGWRDRLDTMLGPTGLAITSRRKHKEPSSSSSETCSPLKKLAIDNTLRSAHRSPPVEEVIRALPCRFIRGQSSPVTVPDNTPTPSTSANSTPAPVPQAQQQQEQQQHTVIQQGENDSNVIADNDELNLTSSEGTLYSSEEEFHLGPWTEEDQKRWRECYKTDQGSLEQDYVVERVIRWRRHPRKKHIEYRVKWKGFRDWYNTWEPGINFNDRKPIENHWKEYEYSGDRSRPKDATRKNEKKVDPTRDDGDTDVEILGLDPERRKAARKRKRLDIRRDRAMHLPRYMQHFRREKRERIHRRSNGEAGEREKDSKKPTSTRTARKRALPSESDGDQPLNTDEESRKSNASVQVPPKLASIPNRAASQSSVLTRADQSPSREIRRELEHQQRLESVKVFAPEPDAKRKQELRRKRALAKMTSQRLDGDEVRNPEKSCPLEAQGESAANKVSTNQADSNSAASKASSSKDAPLSNRKNSMQSSSGWIGAHRQPSKVYVLRPGSNVLDRILPELKTKPRTFAGRPEASNPTMSVMRSVVCRTERPSVRRAHFADEEEDIEMTAAKLSEHGGGSARRAKGQRSEKQASVADCSGWGGSEVNENGRVSLDTASVVNAVHTGVSSTAAVSSIVDSSAGWDDEQEPLYPCHVPHDHGSTDTSIRSEPALADASQPPSVAATPLSDKISMDLGTDSGPGSGPGRPSGDAVTRAEPMSTDIKPSSDGICGAGMHDASGGWYDDPNPGSALREAIASVQKGYPAEIHHSRQHRFEESKPSQEAFLRAPIASDSEIGWSNGGQRQRPWSQEPPTTSHLRAQWSNEASEAAHLASGKTSTQQVSRGWRSGHALPSQQQSLKQWRQQSLSEDHCLSSSKRQKAPLLAPSRSPLTPLSPSLESGCRSVSPSKSVHRRSKTPNPRDGGNASPSTWQMDDSVRRSICGKYHIVRLSTDRTKEGNALIRYILDHGGGWKECITDKMRMDDKRTAIWLPSLHIPFGEIEREAVSRHNFEFLHYDGVRVHEVWPYHCGKVTMFSLGALILKLLDLCRIELSEEGQMDEEGDGWTVSSSRERVLLHPWQRSAVKYLIETGRVGEFLHDVLGIKGAVDDHEFSLIASGIEALELLEVVERRFTHAPILRPLDEPEKGKEISSLLDLTFELDKEVHATLFKLQPAWHSDRRSFWLCLAGSTLQPSHIGTCCRIIPVKY